MPRSFVPTSANGPCILIQRGKRDNNSAVNHDLHRGESPHDVLSVLCVMKRTSDLVCMWSSSINLKLFIAIDIWSKPMVAMQAWLYSACAALIATGLGILRKIWFFYHYPCHHSKMSHTLLICWENDCLQV